MVTQDASVVPRVNKLKIKKMKKKKSKKKKIKGAENLDSESEADKLDLDEKIHPLSHYITEQEELVNQMFLTIRGSKLEAMLPPVLKSIPVKELKRLCLHELRGMSKKRILCCINGQVMEGSSGSEDEEEEKEEANEEQNHKEANSKGEKRKPSDEQPPDYLQKKIKVEPGTEDSTGSREKSVLELLELEMRARIIKTMLEKGDDGKKITEDAIAAVMKSAKKITSEGTGGSEEMASAVADSKDDSQGKKLDRETESEDEVAEERTRGRRRGEGRRGDRKGHRDSAHDGRRGSGTRSQRRRDGNYSDDGSRGRSSRKQKESDSSKTHITKKKKITRKEFEERMKRAKKNRTYRQRKSSEDEEKAKENENKTENTKEDKDDKDEKTEDKADKEPDAPPEGNSIQEKAEGEGEGEVSEKEEGEIDSNEEEEGACSPSDISSASRYSSSRSSSRSWSRSYSRSPSRSPYRGRQRRNSRRTRSRSRSRRRRRSYSRSYSRSRTPERRRRGDHQPRSFDRRGRDSPKANSKKDIKKTSPEDISPSREEDWGHKCDIEFVDSEEDFDDNPEAAKKDSGAQKTLPVNRIERASISFSLQKKPVGIAQGVDLDDLPLKKKQTSDDIEALSSMKPATKSEEIVISSDSEVEVQPSTQSPMKLKADGKRLSEQLVTSANDSKLVELKKTDQSPAKENTGLQSDQEKKFIKKAVNSETKGKESTKENVEGNTEDLKLSTGLNQEMSREKNSSDGAKIIQDISNENMETEKGKQAVENIDKADIAVGVSKGESPVKDPRDSENIDDSGNTESDSDSAPGNRKQSTRKRDINHDNEPMEKSTRKSSTGSVDGASVVLRAECKEKGVNLEKDKTQDINAADNSRVKDVERIDDDGSEISERKGTDSELNVNTEESSDKETRQNIQQGVDVKDKSSIQPLEEKEEEERDLEVTDSDHTVNIKLCKGKKVKKKVGDASVFFKTKQRVGKSEILTTNEQEDAEPESKEVTSIFEGQSEEEFYQGTEQLKFSEDEKDNEDTDGRGSLKEKTSGDFSRAEAGFTRKQVKTHQKIEMVMPERSWMKRGRKKGEKAKALLGMERTGLVKSVQPESAQSPPQESELKAETSQSSKAQESTEVEEIQVHSPALISDIENSQVAEESGRQKQASSSPKQDLVEVSHIEAEDRVRKIDHDTEIIGVIETSKDTSENFDDLGGSSWSMRWLKSEKVQKVVTSSKMLSRVRKKIQRKEKAKVVMAEKVEEAQKPAEPVIPVIGSIEEYERLFGTKVKKDEAPIAGSESQGIALEGQVSAGASQDDIPVSKPRGNPVFGSDDDGEDSEDEALWSKIIKK
ncbi:serine/arginine repetitive matrix protein 2-like [Scylla paramamosain]|uniref:serine/arginine repetitive matrix protein 2-like n=1 Tax=Scylla paramamosain TaxID=85552 RepID=UPI00308368B1